jgi:tetratricopeptide (TPR) repeat protein
LASWRFVSSFDTGRLVARLALATLVTLLALGSGACGAAPTTDPLESIRAVAAESGTGEPVGRLLLGELLVPGGSPARAIAARARLEGMGDDAKKGLFASVARAFDDEVHGRMRSAALAHLDAVVAARTSSHPDAALVAWFSSNHLLALRQAVADLWTSARDVVKQTVDHPGNAGWRARGELVEWWSLDGSRDDAPGSLSEGGLLEAAAKLYGCVEKARLAGPFGHLAAADYRVHYDAERAGPWPAVFPRDPLRLEAPRVHAVERAGCALRAPGAPPGIYYVETFVDLPADREMNIAVQGAFSILVDDTEVLTRDTRVWGIWPRFGARVRLEAGRHRILARVAGPETSIRLQHPTGEPLGLVGSDDPAPPYAIVRPEILPDPNTLAPFLAAVGVPAQPGVPVLASSSRDPNDPIGRALAAYAAHIEGQDDLGAVLLEPLVQDPARKVDPADRCGAKWNDRATGPALALAATLLDKDPIFPGGQTRDCVKEARSRASKADPELWAPRFWLLLDAADKAGVPEVQPELVALADHFPEVPEILRALAAIYARIGWAPEHRRAVLLAAKRFPDDVDALRDLLRLNDLDGDTAAADRVAARIRKLDPEAEVDLERAVERRDFQAAIKELGRLGSLRKDRRDITARIADLLARAGSSRESMAKLEAAVEKKPQDAEARLALADARVARGDKGALARALVDAIHAGAETAPLREAIDLVEGMTELSPYRIDGKKVIAEFEAQKPDMPGTAARVLDYSTIWIHADGSARMLEHEILYIQSREGIQEQAEQRPRGLLLKIRTIKPDGRVLEPEIVSGKETITMPHLQLGDYIETETITTLRGDGQGGQRFEGPRWFFREEKIPYFRSEFITISPKNRPLDLETGGTVPKPEVTESGALVIRRWRVDKSPALPEEPASAPIQEFLPNVRLSWGISLVDTVARMVDAASDETPRDPRLVRVARAIIEGGAPSVEERARRIYHWVLTNVEHGREGDGRRAVIGRSGNRTEAFLYLCRLVGIDAQIGLVKDRLAAPPVGPMSEVETFAAVAVRLATETGSRWMVVRDKFAPYGYMPSSMRGQPAIVLRPGAPRETTPKEGSEDGVTHEGDVILSADGSAMLTIEQRYEGKLAIALREALEQMPEARFKEIIESRLLPQSLPGARAVSVEVKNLTDLDAPLVLHMKLEMSSFARPRGAELVLSPLFPLHLGALTTLPSRETPLYVSENISTRLAVKLRIKLPEGAKVDSELAPTTFEDESRVVRIADRVEGGMLVLDRVMDLPAGRIQPAAYLGFQAFARRADAALHREVQITLAGH